MWLGPSLIYFSTPVAMVTAIRYCRGTVGRVRYWSLLLLALTLAQLLFISALTTLGVYQNGLQFFFGVVGIRT